MVVSVRAGDVEIADLLMSRCRRDLETWRGSGKQKNERAGTYNMAIDTGTLDISLDFGTRTKRSQCPPPRVEVQRRRHTRVCIVTSSLPAEARKRRRTIVIVTKFTKESQFPPFLSFPSFLLPSPRFPCPILTQRIARIHCIVHIMKTDRQP